MLPTDNDNDSAVPAGGRDGAYAEGQAALLLVESLIHGLLAQSVITLADAVEIVETAAEVRADLTHEGGGADALTHRSSLLLDQVAQSLRTDLS